METAAIISPDTTREMLDSLMQLDIRPIIIPRCPDVAPALSGHPDLQVFVRGTTVYCRKNMPRSFIKSVEKLADVIPCPTELSPRYPGDCAFNIACIGNRAFHRFDCTDTAVREALAAGNLREIHVRQGYSKCSTVIIDETRIITADTMIHRKAIEEGLSSLLITSGHVDLPGYDYGFLGGASGTTGSAVLFTGTIKNHPDHDRILSFIGESGKKIVFLTNDIPVDIGSILFIAEHAS